MSSQLNRKCISIVRNYYRINLKFESVCIICTSLCFFYYPVLPFQMKPLSEEVLPWEADTHTHPERERERGDGARHEIVYVSLKEFYNSKHM